MLFTGCNFGAHVPNLSKAIILFLSLVFQVRVWNPTNINEVETNLQVQFLHQEHLSISKVSWKIYSKLNLSPLRNCVSCDVISTGPIYILKFSKTATANLQKKMLLDFSQQKSSGILQTLVSGSLIFWGSKPRSVPGEKAWNDHISPTFKGHPSWLDDDLPHPTSPWVWWDICFSFCGRVSNGAPCHLKNMSQLGNCPEKRKGLKMNNLPKTHRSLTGINIVHGRWILPEILCHAMCEMSWLLVSNDNGLYKETCISN